MSAAGSGGRYLLFGAGGQLGVELARAIAPLGAVRALARRDVDVGDAAAVRAAVRAARPTVVLNAAAYTAVDAAESDAERCALVNAVAPGTIAAAAEEVGAAVVHFSTDYVFDGAARTPYRETDPTHPLGVYGATKLAGEAAVAAASTAHLTFRLGWLYATHGRNFLRTMLRLARERDELRVVSDQVGAPTWARPVAAATAQLLAVAARAPGGATGAVRGWSGVYHLTAGGETSWHGFAEAILAADPGRGAHRCRAVRAIGSDEYPSAARRPSYSVLDSGRAASALGLRLPDWRRQLALALAEGGG
ncbi:MAG: dTDP-4-dehydrorhamnose reductase [uncultured Gemmatimonadaceae bacterium]|uniref:dTDP-4-dehydrorhamnose reductase n=1 Tax=uncultured Gemmatimonadaceae bacterium TaxID=246130 RepID=A0A6J4KH66_9BACT|nr:MAG: dTDP-4-dehydrorhamnose reductase [uncultured Gemmatimonadaceae bacterium]